MATVLRSTKKPMEVKNLGWLLRHWKDVKWIGFNYYRNGAGKDGQLVAKLCDSFTYATYSTDFASLSVCVAWLDRPIFRGVDFRFVESPLFDKRTELIIGSAQWKKLIQLDNGEKIADYIAAIPPKQI